MSIAIGRDVQQCYETIVSGDGSTTWGVFGYEGQSELKVQASGADNLDEFAEEFSDGRLQYAFLRVLEPNSKLPKFVLVGWCGDGAPRKGVFQQHFSSVASKLSGYHVQLTARSEEDLSETNIMKKVEDASGAKYSVSNVSSAASAFGQSTTPRKATTNSLVNQLKGQNAPTFNPKKPTLTEPRLPQAAPKPSTSRTVSSAPASDTWDTPKTNDRGRVEPEKSKVFETKEPANEPVKSSYQPIGRPDINALRAQGEAQNPSLSSSAGTSYQPVEVPKTGSLADRMAAFTNKNAASDSTNVPTARKASNPLASRFGGSIGGTKPTVPSTGARDSQAIGGLGKNFGSENGKTPAQLWAERKARERGESIPEPIKEAPVKATTYDDDENEDRAGVASIRDRFAAANIQDEPEAPKPVSLPPPPRMARSATPEPEEAEQDYEEVRETAHPPPPPMSSRPGGSVLPPPPTMPMREDTPEPDPESEPEPDAEPVYEPESEPEVERVPSPEPEPVKNSFKAQLEQSLGGGGGVKASAPVFATDAPAATHSHTETASSAPKATVLYEYEAQEDNEINLAEGEFGKYFPS